MLVMMETALIVYTKRNIIYTLIEHFSNLKMNLSQNVSKIDIMKDLNEAIFWRHTQPVFRCFSASK